MAGRMNLLQSTTSGVLVGQRLEEPPEFYGLVRCLRWSYGRRGAVMLTLVELVMPSMCPDLRTWYVLP